MYNFCNICLFILRLVVAIDVDEDPRKDAENGGEYTEEGNTGKLVDNLYTQEDDKPHDEQHRCSINLKWI